MPRGSQKPFQEFLEAGGEFHARLPGAKAMAKGKSVPAGRVVCRQTEVKDGADAIIAFSALLFLKFCV